MIDGSRIDGMKAEGPQYSCTLWETESLAFLIAAKAIAECHEEMDGQPGSLDAVCSLNVMRKILPERLKVLCTAQWTVLHRSESRHSKFYYIMLLFSSKDYNIFCTAQSQLHLAVF